MGVFKNILIAVLLISFITFVALFGRLPAFRNGPIGFLHRLVLIIIPSAFCRLDNLLTGGRMIKSFERIGHYLLNENHPLILILFLVFLISSQVLFLPASFSRLSSFQRATTIVLCVIPHIFTYKTIKSTSSYITKENHATNMQQYPYDEVIFQSGRVCRTCCFAKPARSKHCSICKTCVAKHDHHCVWVMNCIGKSNYAYFIGMLLSLGLLLVYGGYLAYVLLTESLQHENSTLDRQHWSTGLSWERYFDLWLWAIGEDIRVGGVGLLAALTAPLAWGLFWYHIYLIWAGMTTNETSKWADLKEDIADGFIFQSKRPAGNMNVSLGSESKPLVNWPISNEQWLIRCEDGQPPDDEVDNASSTSTRPAQKPRWERLQSLNEVNNLYDLGFWRNLVDVIST